MNDLEELALPRGIEPSLESRKTIDINPPVSTGERSQTPSTVNQSRLLTTEELRISRALSPGEIMSLATVATGAISYGIWLYSIGIIP